ncbi:winged helix-turn-helix domain-containing protein [Dokdonella soli]|uniref:OmpR/PhoB-type domain-containing protein n=1 Tax=Dokdonella soli TaxID=529810 RepID=A0ABN1ILA4_9GAMM
MGATEYRFGNFRLVPHARELWKGGDLVHLPRRGFDCLAYLVEHRDRAVGRDELVAALWGRVDATDSQVNQVVLRARLAVGDDGQIQRMIRTVPGFGYRWIAEIDGQSAAPETTVASSAADASVAVPSAAPAADAMAAATAEASRRRSPSAWSLAFVAMLVLTMLAYALLTRRMSPSPSANAAGSAIVVLPLDVTAPREAGWVRLGAMDLIADRLRSAGLPVPPSDSVVAVLHEVGEPLDAVRLAKLQQTLGAALIVRGSAVKSAAGWKVELSTTSTDGTQHRETSEQADMTEAARRSADLLVAALGHTQAAGTAENDDLQELLQQAQAALLANELDAARSILANAPEPARSDARVRAKLAQVDFRAGKLDTARAALDELLANPSVKAQPRTYAQALSTRGFIDIRREDCASAEPYFDTAVSALHDTPPSHERDVALAARGLSHACLRQFDAAIADLGKAREQLEAAGDRMGIARINNYFGVLETQRNRMADAVPYFVAAADTSESFGVIETLRANLSALFITQAHLLRWPDALATSERLWKLRARVSDPALLLAASGFRSRALMALGRYREAEAGLTEAEKTWPDAHGELIRYFHEARAELAWRQGQADRAVDAADKALAVWTSAPGADDAERARIVLLRQRASIAAGKPIAAYPTATGLPPTPAAGSDIPAAHFVAQAEWAAHEKRDADAEPVFRAAAASAEAKGVPDEIALVANAYAGWLLARGRTEDAGALAGRIAPWADHDFDCALLQVKIFHAAGQRDAWARALKQVQALAGEREIPAELLKAPIPA